MWNKQDNLKKIKEIIVYQKLSAEEQQKKQMPVLEKNDLQAVYKATETPLTFYEVCGDIAKTAPLSEKLEFHKEMKKIFKEKNVDELLVNKIHKIHIDLIIQQCIGIVAYKDNWAKLSNYLGFSADKSEAMIENRKKIYSIFFHSDNLSRIPNFSLRSENINSNLPMQQIAATADYATKNLLLPPITSFPPEEHPHSESKEEVEIIDKDLRNMLFTDSPEFLGMFVQLPNNLNTLTLKNCTMILTNLIEQNKSQNFEILLTQQIFIDALFLEDETYGNFWGNCCALALNHQNITIINSLMKVSNEKVFLLQLMLCNFDETVFQQLYQKNYWNYTDILPEITDHPNKFQFVKIMLEKAIKNKHVKDYLEILDFVNKKWPTDQELLKITEELKTSHPLFYKSKNFQNTSAKVGTSKPKDSNNKKSSIHNLLNTDSSVPSSNSNFFHSYVNDDTQSFTGSHKRSNNFYSSKQPTKKANTTTTELPFLVVSAIITSQDLATILNPTVKAMLKGPLAIEALKLAMNHENKDAINLLLSEYVDKNSPEVVELLSAQHSTFQKPG